MSVPRLVMLAALALITLAPARARADQAPRHRLEWTFPSFRAEEYAAATAVSLLGLSMEFRSARIPDGGWNGGIGFDDRVRSGLRAESPAGRDRAARVSDVLWMATQWYPIVDSLVVPLATDRGNTKVASQMLLLDWQAQSFAFLVTRGFHRVIGRRRPSHTGCEERRDGCPGDGNGGNASFVSGHTSMSFAGAGLACAHHQALPLYGGAWDPAACAIAVAAATTTGTLRIVADKHWTTDVMLGASMGFAIGYGMPTLLHYSMRTDAPLGRIGKRGVIVPDVQPGSYGARFIALL